MAWHRVWALPDAKNGNSSSMMEDGVQPVALRLVRKRGALSVGRLSNSERANTEAKDRAQLDRV